MHTNISLLLKNKLYLFEYVCVCVSVHKSHEQRSHEISSPTSNYHTMSLYKRIHSIQYSFLCRKFEILFYCTHRHNYRPNCVRISLPLRPILIFIIKSFSWLLRNIRAHARHVFEVNAPLALRFFGSGSQLIILCLLRTARVSYIIFYPLAEMNKCVW